MQPERKIYSIPEAAAFLRVGRSTVYNLIKAGRLPIRKLGHRSLVLGEDLNALVDALPTSSAEDQDRG